MPGGQSNNELVTSWNSTYLVTDTSNNTSASSSTSNTWPVVGVCLTMALFTVLLDLDLELLVCGGMSQRVHVPYLVGFIYVPAAHHLSSMYLPRTVTDLFHADVT